MVLSRAQSQEALEHVLTNVFGEANPSPLQQALQHEGMLDINDLLTMTDDDINGLEYIAKDA